MPSRFPGMDPYIEAPDRWPDFHGRFIAAIVGTLQPLLRPKYVATGEERVYVAETERLIRPDVAVLRTSGGVRATIDNNKRIPPVTRRPSMSGQGF